MKSLSRILTVCLCCVPTFGAVANIATTSGSNLTAYNPSNSYNNQWATVSNARYDGNTTAKVDFGNCNAVVLRCAQPKCNNGGCVDPSVASAIVSGCVKANSKCKQYGDDLIEYMTAQLVASSNAKINEQQMALEQARLQAEANAAAASAQNEQISQMQNQMYQMQQQMAQQQAESAQALQEALTQQAAQSAAALEDMRTAATDAAKQTEAGITAYQQDAINRGISEEVLARQQITGQIQTEIEDAETSLVAMKKAMQNAFDYAECDARGNNCSAPKRIKKWRELAIGFLTPYDNAIDKIYDALVTAQTVGVDLSDIYMMLNNSCNSWGQYMCEKGANINYLDSGPVSCPKTSVDCSYCVYRPGTGVPTDYQSIIPTLDKKCYEQCLKDKCRPCTLLKVLSDKAEVYEGWINTDATDTENTTVVACASNALDNTKLFARRTKNKNGAGLVDIDLLDRWLNQTEPNKVKDTEKAPAPQEYCEAKPDEEAENALSSAILSRVVNTEKTISGSKNGTGFCVNWEGKNLKRADTDDCPYINPIFAICDTHPFNSGNDVDFLQDESSTSTTDKTDAQADMNRIIGLKVTVVSQQMYKQYEYLNATLRRLKTQLQKAVLTSNLEAAGAKSESGSSSGLLGGGKDTDKTIHLAGAENCSNKTSSESAYNCLQTNISLIISSAPSNRQKACKQLQSTIKSAQTWNLKLDSNSGCDADKLSCRTEDIVSCAQKLNVKVITAKEEKAEKQQSRTIYRGIQG
ncbi:MAG: hypothetical protein ACLRFP_01550 [Alphaproteobacteria bacterium]